MTRLRFGGAVLAALLGLVADATPAEARGDANLGADGINGGLTVPGAPGAATVSPPGPTGNGTPPSTSSYAYQSLNTPCSLTGPGTGAVLGTSGFDPNGTVGTVNAVLLTTGGQSSLVNYVCVVPGQPPPLPPPPPTPAEIWGKVPLSTASIGANPDAEGLTGLETLLWYEGAAGGVQLNLSIRGYSVAVRARPVLFTWNTGDGTVSSVRSPGSAASPALNHIYETRGDFTVSLVTTWEGSYSFSGFDVSSGGSLGAVTVSRSRPYHVIEARSVLAP
jgi:hypothetical protein